MTVIFLEKQITFQKKNYFNSKSLNIHLLNDAKTDRLMSIF